jgi:predicted metal-dependent hydrolase
LAHVVGQLHWLEGRPDWRLLEMKTQWGSCSPKGAMLLNPHLVKAPTECIDYVILHELCHLEEHNHSQRFYDLLSYTMPRWEVVKSRLDGMSEMLLNE